MNVVLITTDQQKRDTVSAYGGSICATPNIDRIAQAGIRFDRAYTQHPYCQSSRATILTGLYASTHGVWNNGVDVPDSLVPQAITSRLRDVGWHTGFTGKGHFSTALTFQPTDRPENVAGSASYDPTTWDGPYMGFEWNRLAILGHYPATMMTPPQGMHYTAHVFHDGLDAGRARTALMGPQAKTDPSVTAPEPRHAAVADEMAAAHPLLRYRTGPGPLGSAAIFDGPPPAHVQALGRRMRPSLVDLFVALTRKPELDRTQF